MWIQIVNIMLTGRVLELSVGAVWRSARVWKCPKYGHAVNRGDWEILKTPICSAFVPWVCTNVTQLTRPHKTFGKKFMTTLSCRSILNSPPPSYNLTDKSTYIDQIAHLCLFAVGTMPYSTAPVLDTCRNTMWVHVCRHISGTGAAPLPPQKCHFLTATLL